MRTAILQPDAPLSEIPRSDTIFGAVCWGIRLSEGEERLEEVLQRFADDDPPFQLSSAYPVVAPEDEKRRTHLLPRPTIPMQSAIDTIGKKAQIDAFKRWQRLNYIPESLFHKIVSGEVPQKKIIDIFSNTGLTITVDGLSYRRAGQFLLPDFDYSTHQFQAFDVQERQGERAERESTDWRPFRSAERMRNAVNRLSNGTEGQLFNSRSVHVADGSAIYIAINGDINLVLTGLATIQDHGIGGDKSVGKGTFELGMLDEIELPSADKEYFCTLSLCIPRESALEQSFTEGFYNVETRKGVLESSLVDGTDIWKKKVLTVTEGSILPATDKYIGHNPIVADRFEHGVQQFGYELPVGVNTQNW